MMPFKSYDELINMADRDPEEARRKIAKARKRKLSVVSENNPGYKSSQYRKKAISDRMTDLKQKDRADPPKFNYKTASTKNVKSSTSPTLSQNKKAVPKEVLERRMASLKDNKKVEDEVIARRKKIGY
jgi:hypothetical protein